MPSRGNARRPSTERDFRAPSSRVGAPLLQYFFAMHLRPRVLTFGEVSKPGALGEADTALAAYQELVEQSQDASLHEGGTTAKQGLLRFLCVGQEP